MNHKMIGYTLGWMSIFECGFFLIPILTALIYRETDALFGFLLSAVICAAFGALLVLCKPKNTDLRARDGFVIVSLAWILLSAFGALPFILSGVTADYIDAFFETVSGFTTAGSSVFGDVESLPKAILIWRSFTHWIGGMGILVFVIAFLPLSGGQNMHLMRAESPGPSVSKLVPRIRMTAFVLYAIYFALTVLQLILLLCGGMPFFDAVNTTFSTAGTGGFSIRNDGMNSYTVYQQAVTTAFMLLFSFNFGSYFLIVSKKFKGFFTSEIKTFLLIAFSAVTLITLNVRGMFDSLWEAIHHVLFTVSSLISTTGFVTVDFNQWPDFSKAVLLLLMFVGACAGSTGGGMKVSRIMILFKSLRNDLSSAIHPKQVRKVTLDGRTVDDGTVRSAHGYMMCFFGVFIVAFLLLSLETASDFVTNFTAITAAVGNVGPGLGLVGPTGNFGFYSPLSKLVLSFCMLAGRLEYYPMLILFAPSTWKK